MIDTGINHQHIITDYLDNKDVMYMRTILIFLQDDPHGHGVVKVHASIKEGTWERSTFYVEANTDTARIPYLLEAITIASKWITINPSFWITEGEKLNYAIKTSGGKAAYDAANAITKEYNRSRSKKYSKK